MLQTCMFRSTSPPGPCDQAIVNYHSFLENGNLRPSLGLLPNTHQQPTLPAKLKGPMEGGNDYAEK
jgi:hypothetical protein